METEAYSALCQYAQTLDEDACRELAEWFGQCFPRDVLLVVTPQLPALLDLLGLRRYESVFTHVFTSLMQGVRDWSERSGANAVLLPEGATSGKADDVKPLKAQVVAPKRPLDCDRMDFFPDRRRVFSVNFEPDPDCQRAMENAVSACRKFFEPLQMLGLLWSYYWGLPIWKPVLPVAVGTVVAMDIWQGAPAAFWTVLFLLFCLFCLPVGLSSWWGGLLGRASVYFKLEGVVAGQLVKDRSMGLAAAIAVLLALWEAYPSLRLLLPIAPFAKCLSKERADWGFSGEIEKDGMVRAVGGVSLKQEAFSEARINRTVFPRENQPPCIVNQEKPGCPTESQAGALADRQPAPLYTLGELRPYWVASLMFLLLGPLEVFKLRRVIVTIAASVVVAPCLIGFHPEQEARIVDGYVNQKRLVYSKGAFQGEVTGVNEYRFRLYIWANRYNPPLELRVTLPGDVVGGCDPDLDPQPGQSIIPVATSGETNFTLYLSKTNPSPLLQLEVITHAGVVRHINHVLLRTDTDRRQN